MPTQTAENLAPIDVSTGHEAPEAELCLDQVARRLNRLTLQRAAYRSLATGLLAASAAAACATWLPPLPFRVALVLLGSVTLAILALSIRGARARWSNELEAARWVERKVTLDQRLVTLVSARPANASSRLWPELVADNQWQLVRWGKQRLGIATIPLNVFLLLAALGVAWLFLVPWHEEAPSLPSMKARAVAARGGESREDGEGAASAVGTQGLLLGGGGSPEGGSGPSVKIEGDAGAALDELQSELAQSFERSLGGSAVLREGAKPGGAGKDDSPERGDVAESGLGKSKAEEGGVVPDEDLARREQDDGSGQEVRRRAGEDGEIGSGIARSKSGQRGRPSQPGSQAQAVGGAQAGGKAMPGGDSQTDGPMALGTEEGKKSNVGGTGAGSGKATEALLAKEPLTLSGGRQTARFALMLGGASGSAGAGGPKAMIGQPRSRIADVEHGPQEADRAVRHEEIPAEYETVVKRIFKRE